MQYDQLHLNENMFMIVELISKIIFTTFNDNDFEFIIDMIRENLYIEESESESEVWTESDEEELTNEEIDYLNNITNDFNLF